MKQIIGYVRVSTKRQGASGLGLDAQVQAIRDHAASVRGDVIATYREVESGRNSARPQLARAIAHAKRIRGQLVIGKLDRLSRNVFFIAGLLENRVDFVACDNPHATRFTIHILAAVAEYERDQISKRVMEALRMAKKKGVLMGSARPDHWAGREHRRREGARIGCEAARQRRIQESAPIYAAALAIAKPLHERRASLQTIANALNALEKFPPGGKPWQRTQVRRLLKSNE